MVDKPSEQLRQVLSGEVDMKDAPEAIQSWARFPIYQAAKQVLAEPEKGNRRNMLGRIPSSVRPYVAAEIMRLHKKSPMA